MPKKTITEPSESAAPSFEVAFHELEEIVAQLERGDLPLEQALELHERGQKLAAYCAAQLEQAELHVRKLDINQE
jgi:exodeoxyribonuclease VII small subunit